MYLDIIEKSKQFLITYLREKKDERLDLQGFHPWRKDSNFIILHSLRVYSYALELIEFEKHRLSSEDILLIKLAAILHDIGKGEGRENHASASVAVIDTWLKENEDIANKIPNKEKLFKIVECHSDKDKPEPDLCSAILKDADIIDEIGVLSIFMAANRVNIGSAFFFNQLLDRCCEFEIPFCDKQINKLNTLHAKEILESKTEFISNFIKELTYELNGTEELYKVYKEINIEGDVKNES